MKGRTAVCPSCNTLLAIPPGTSNCHVRCGQCRNRFRLPRRVPVTDDVVTDWLFEDNPVTAEQQEQAASAIGLSLEEADSDQTQSDLSGMPCDETMVAHVVSRPHHKTHRIRLVRISDRGALLEFPASRLTDLHFRCSVPRRCLRCGSRQHLHAHVIIYTPELTDSLSLEDEHRAGALQLSNEEIRGLTGEQILARLPRVPNVPAPADLPMPYYLCDMCRGPGMISGQIRVNANTGRGLCRLQLRNIELAEELLVTVGGAESEDHERLKQVLQTRRDRPWEMLPESVQHRLIQWYRPHNGEYFVQYIPDRDRARTEDGMCGLIITSRRLIYHDMRRHHESTLTEPIKLSLSTGEECGRLSVRASGWRVNRMKVDRNGIKSLRRALVQSKAKAFWQ